MSAAFAWLFETLDHPAAWLDRAGGVRDVNAAWREAFGGVMVEACFPAFDATARAAAVGACHANGGVESLGVHATASRRWRCEVAAVDGGAFFVARGQAAGDRPRDAAPSRGARFEQLIEGFPMAIGVHRGGSFVYVNPAAVRYLGYADAQDLAGAAITDVVHPADVAEVHARVAAIAQTGVPAPERETRLVRRDGSEVLAEVSGFLVDLDDGKPAFVVVARDISERKKLEEQLRHGRRMEAIGRLAGGIAHDFNNHLAVILNYADFLIHGLPSEDPLQRDAVEIRHAARRAAALTTQLLTFSRGGLSEIEVLDVNAVVDGLLDFLRRTLGADIELVTDLARGLPAIRGARTHLEQVLVNLAVNARDATPSGGELRIGTGARVVNDGNVARFPNLTAGRYVVLEVSDNGRGMSPGVASRAFEPFFTTKPDGKGTGLGLSTVYGIVTQAGGDIELDSVLGRGTTFRILWPADDASATSPRVSAAGVPRRARADTVLLVEDDAAVRALVARMLANFGFAVIEAIDAVEALQLVEDAQPELDALVTDVIMPRMTGPELAVALQSLYPGLPVVFMSGYAADVLEQHDLEGDAVTFLPKPFVARELREKIELARARAPTMPDDA